MTILIICSKLKHLKQNKQYHNNKLKYIMDFNLDHCTIVDDPFLDLDCYILYRPSWQDCLIFRSTWEF